MLPTGILLHDTAGRLTPGSSVSWFADPRSRVSAHFVVEIDGSVTQMVDCDCIAHHAGKSSWDGKPGCNSRFIGIEIVNPGKLTPAGVAWFGEVFEGAIFASTKEHGSGCWLPYTPAQIEAVKRICKAIVEAYPIKHICTHWQVSPGRKVDCNPLFPLDEVKAYAFSRQPTAGTDGWPLQKGSEGSNVSELQQRLLDLGYSMVRRADRDFGTQTEAGVLAWEAAQGLTKDGKIDRDEFEILMSADAKPFATGPATAEADAKRKAAAVKLEAAASATVATSLAASAGEAVANRFDVSLWDTTMHALGQAGEAVSKVQTMGVQIEPRYAVAGLAAVLGIALWRYSRIARG